ncbi:MULTISPECIES: hypothetical protein [unclassified Flavobacterium]|jgi:hypothetical protein|uniref:hypothetical protein n=1 Tax=unclassified Flavobacterium TaxID=196869 RepID=UPI0025C50B6E|nr:MULTISPECIES: hypothetical protein [unclassified Flavobacterium]
MTNSIKIILALLLIVLTNILGHYFPPTSITLSPLTIGLLTGLLIFTDFKFGYRILLITLAIIVNDICIKDFAGGTYDLEGEGFISAFLIIGLIISTIIILIKTVVLKNMNAIVKIMLTLMMPVIMFLYLQYFGLYGLSFSKSMSLTKENAIENKTFLSDLYFSESEIIYDIDSIRIISGWIEKEIMLNHNSLICKSEETGNINYKIKIKHNFKPYDFSIYYKVNSDDVNGANPVDSVLEFTANKSDSITLTIFKLRNGSVNNDTIIKRVTIKPK